ncbi:MULTISPECIES: RNA polymerase sigma-70 factor [unclassified Parabacteroides]|uniref:RNA polymerase sigma-70 factor n=1 Tax=unclassified Parabacteroides TaxID=2649774 RepID=UPI000EFDC50F|nr:MULTISPECIES: RNA polymerase sigma-70 factor [unclassified Parabacteroides]RHO67336.1 RNA polymerase sigma-70 factor [Parabacteroides sp. AF48-14]RHR56940.1 RNA polymerase sigma-70 factor [Parabacteroides sp. AF17-28]
MNTISFSDIYTNYYKRSFLFVKSYVRDDMVAEDIVSEALIRFWETTKKETVEHPMSLLLAILKNGALNYLKHQTVKDSATESISSKMIRDLNYRITTLQACDPEEIYSSEITGIVEKTLQSLPEQTRRIFEMSRYESIPVKEIAQELSLSTKSVEYHITKALKLLRVALKEYLPLFYFLFMR